MSLPRRLDRLARLATNLMLYPVSALAPRSGGRWVFGHAGEAFAGNPKYLYLWLRLHRPDIRATWITGSDRTHRQLSAHDLPVVRRWSVKGVAAALGARVFAFSHDPEDVNAPLSRGALHLNLWHGVGLKALHTGAKPAGGPWGWLRSFLYIPYDLVVSTSDRMQAHFARQFGISEDRCPQLGYPRLDWAGDPPLAALAAALDGPVNLGDHAETYLYMPTFRDTGRAFLAEAFPDMAALDAVLAARDAVLYVKLHPRSMDVLPDGYAHIRAWPGAIDFQRYLGMLTGLITDYSSVLYDYLAVRDEGVILYTFDHDDYVRCDRALAGSLEDDIVGVRIAAFGDLCAVLRDGTALDRGRMGDVEAIRARFWGGSHHPASAAIVEYVERALASRNT